MEAAMETDYTVSSISFAKYTTIGLITLYLLKQLWARAERKKMHSIAAEKINQVLKERDENIGWARREAEKIGDEERRRIEKMDFRQLREALQSGTVTAESAVRVYFGRAVKAHERTNCLTNILKQSLTDARVLDEKAKDPTYVKPRLFGMPISIKEANQIEGQLCTWGFVQAIDNIANEDAFALKKLRMDGMIPFCQTNVPTMCLAYTCDNSIYGMTSNPHSAARTCGGSSGGEGALIGAGGSLVGMGSDLGGSIRIPCSFSGCCGFRPSANRFSTLLVPEPIPWRPFCMPTEGPMAQDPYALVEILRSVWSDHFTSNEDALSVPVDFREDLFREGATYRIGYYSTDGYIDPLPGNQRVIKEAVEMLKAKGHELVPFSMDDIVHETARGIFGTIFADGGSRGVERLKEEPLTPLMEPIRGNMSMHSWTRKLFGWVFRFLGEHTTADFFLSQPTTATEVQIGIDRIYGCRKRLVQKMSNERIDLILCPTTICPAMPHSLPNQVPFTAIMSTIQWNAMDFPAGVVTTGSWTEADEAALEAHPAKGWVETEVKKGAKNSVGLPLSVQIVAPSFRDEMALRMMVDLYEAVREKQSAEALQV